MTTYIDRPTGSGVHSNAAIDRGTSISWAKRATVSGLPSG